LCLLSLYHFIQNLDGSFALFLLYCNLKFDAARVFEVYYRECVEDFPVIYPTQNSIHSRCNLGSYDRSKQPELSFISDHQPVPIGGIHIAPRPAADGVRVSENGKIAHWK